MKIGKFIIAKEKAGVISKRPCWVIFYSYYMHTGDTLIDCVIDVVKNWKSEYCIAG